LKSSLFTKIFIDFHSSLNFLYVSRPLSGFDFVFAFDLVFPYFSP